VSFSLLGRKKNSLLFSTIYLDFSAGSSLK